MTIEVVNGAFNLVDITTNAGWEAEIDELDDDDVRIEFTNGDLEWEFRADLEGSTVSIRIRDKS